MATVEREAALGASRRTRRSDVWRPASAGPRRLAPVAAALVIGLVSGSLVMGGPWQTSSTRSVAAAAIVRHVQAAAAALQTYQATYTITERGLSPQIPERNLTMRVAFRAPGRFRIDVRDETSYPSAAWTPTDLTYIADGPSTFRSGPTGCPSDLPAGVCPPTRVTVSHDIRFDPGAPIAADLVLPLITLGSAQGVRVLGTGSMLGRDAVRLELPFARAQPLFPFLRLGGTWRPFFAGDRVVLTLDRAGWFPLRATVYPSTGPDRRAWELRFGLPVEPPAEPILDMRVTSLDEHPPASSAFAIPGGAGRAVPLSEFSTAVGYVPVTPTQPDDLRLASAIVPPRSDANGPTSVLTYARGLSYLVIGERPDWRGPGPFGPLDATAEQVAIDGDGIGYYGPATQDHGRVLAIHAANTDLFLETNLPRTRLLSIASTLPIRGEAIPRAWRAAAVDGLGSERLSLAEARGRAPFPIDLPASLPAGSVLASVELGSGAVEIGVTLTFAQRVVDVAGGAIRLHIERAAGLPPASSAEQEQVELPGGAIGRWTPSRDRLEWVQDGLYRSIDGPGLDLATALEIAGSIPRPATGAASP
jgi:hypothetical protein